MTGAVSFDYTNNSGHFTIDAADHQFTVGVATAGPGSIHLMKDPADIRTVALAPGASTFVEVGDGTNYDGSSRHRTVKVGDAAVLQNQNGYWAALLVDQVKTRESSATGEPVLRFRYAILPSKAADFSVVR